MLVPWACTASLGTDGSVNATISTGTGDGAAGAPFDDAGETGNRDDSVSKYSCDSRQAQLQGRSYDHLRRLSRDELAATLQALLGDELYSHPSIAARIEGLPSDTQFSATDYSKDPPPNLPIALGQIASQVATLGLSDEKWRSTHLPPCAENDLNQACVEEFVRTFGARVWRRPLGPELVTSYLEFYDAAGGGEAGLSLLLRRMLQAPSLVFHIEEGADESGEDGRLKLTPFEIASRISYLSMGGPPDTKLQEAAEASELDTEEQILSHVTRLLQTPLGKEKVRDFFRYYTHLDTVADPNPSTAKLAGIDRPEGLGQKMREELFSYAEGVMYEDAGSFADLMTSTRSYPHSEELARIFGIDDFSPNGATDTPRHPGLLHRPALLQSTGRRTNLIVRGARIREAFLCDELPSPDPQALFAGLKKLEATDDLSNREAVEQVTASPACSRCHEMINPLGALFEHYDQLGSIREEETLLEDSGSVFSTFPIDSSVVAPAVDPNGTSHFDDSSELVAALAHNEKAHACFRTKLFEYFRRRAPDEDLDGCVLVGSAQETDAPLVRTVARIISNPSIFWKEMPSED